jgi:hypothetical protein
MVVANCPEGRKSAAFSLLGQLHALKNVGWNA